MSALPTYTSKSLIFVTGASRSGTTVMCQALGRHSSVLGLREMHYFGSPSSPNGDNRCLSAAEARSAVAMLFERQRKARFTGEARDEEVEMGRVISSLAVEPLSGDVFASTVEFFAHRAGKTIPCEQTPRNIYYARSILEQFPQARIVHLLRDPHAVMASQKARWRKRAMLADPSQMTRIEQARVWCNYHPHIVADLWNRATSEALQLRNHPRFVVVKFEDLIAEPETTIRELCKFLELNFEPDMLNVEHTNSSHVRSTGQQLGFSKSLLTSRRAGLTAEESAVISERCARLMSEVGYEDESLALTRWSRVALRLSYAAHLAGALLINPRRLWIQGRAMWRRPRQSRTQAARTPERTSEVGGANGPASSKSVFGMPCMDMDLYAAADYLIGCVQSKRKRRVAFINANCLNESVVDRELLYALRIADIRFADGVGMLLASLMHGSRLHYNVNGTDLFPYLCARAAAAGVSMALLGGVPGVTDECVSVLQRTNPGLRIVYHHDGFLRPEDDTKLVSEINASGAGILLVAMGVPLQELWIRDHGGRLTVPVVIGVGGLFDFVSGRVPRAPSIVRMLKAEWLFRLFVEPRRLFSRYVLGNPLFLIRASRYALTGRFGRERGLA